MDEFEFEKDFDPSVPVSGNIITAAMMRKRVIWDVAPDHLATQVVAHLGLQPASPEVEQMEMQEAYRRLQLIGPLYPFVADLARHAAEAMRGAMIVQYGEGAVSTNPGYELDALTMFIAQSAAGILAEMLDVGALHMPHIAFIEGTPTGE